MHCHRSEGDMSNACTVPDVQYSTCTVHHRTSTTSILHSVLMRVGRYDMKYFYGALVQSKYSRQERPMYRTSGWSVRWKWILMRACMDFRAGDSTCIRPGVKSPVG